MAEYLYHGDSLNVIASEHSYYLWWSGEVSLNQEISLPDTWEEAIIEMRAKPDTAWVCYTLHFHNAFLDHTTDVVSWIRAGIYMGSSDNGGGYIKYMNNKIYGRQIYHTDSYYNATWYIYLR